MLECVAVAARMLAVLQYAASSSARDDASPAELKAAAARAHESFIQAAYGVAFSLMPYLLRHGEEITTKTEVRYGFAEAGFVLQKMNLDPKNPGVFLVPDQVSAENFLQLMIDLPELLEILGL